MRIQWTLVVTAEEGLDEGEAVMRLKGLLKVAGRRFGMRCTTVGEERLVPRAMKGGRRSVWRSRLKEGG